MPDAPTSRPRLSLTRRQLESHEALDLLQLLQSITSDGRLTDDEIAALTYWLMQHAESDLPAIAHLRGVLETALADQRITAEERRWIQQEVERVLPADVRRAVSVQRRDREEENRQAARAARDAERERERLSRPIGTFDFMVAGAYYDGRQTVIETVAAGDPVRLARELTNQYSRNAIILEVGGGANIGYVPEEDAVEMAPLLDAGAIPRARVKKVLRGGKGAIPVVEGCLYDASATAAAGPEPELVDPRARRRPHGAGPATLTSSYGAGADVAPRPRARRPDSRKATTVPLILVVGTVVAIALLIALVVIVALIPPDPTRARPAPLPTRQAVVAPTAAPQPTGALPTPRPATPTRRQLVAPAPVTGGRCAAITRAGHQCSRKASPGSSYCWQHQR